MKEFEFFFWLVFWSIYGKGGNGIFILVKCRQPLNVVAAPKWTEKDRDRSEYRK